MREASVSIPLPQLPAVGRDQATAAAKPSAGQSGVASGGPSSSSSSSGRAPASLSPAARRSPYTVTFVDGDMLIGRTTGGGVFVFDRAAEGEDEAEEVEGAEGWREGHRSATAADVDGSSNVVIPVN